MRRRNLHQLTFTLAGIYNIVWGIWANIDPNWLFRFAGMPLLNYPEIFGCLGMVIGLYGVVYLEIARKPERGFVLALVGFVGKVLGPAGLIYFIYIGKWTLPSIIMCVTNDFIWWIPFLIYLFDAWSEFRYDYFRS
jgi:hypothetical protein